ncbi:uncharacterized protein LOC124277984 [Haliotis rubra]|uniref:uncharacterized protein LOC124277984 n=1 Tax=Haliotis rubra TaxID=36100 RepID=UPI001EE5B81D|nr:uncharacterized protein LOC124277984 [Haliotis rubra]
MNTLVAIALLLVVPALYVQGGNIQQTAPPPAPTTPPVGTGSPQGGNPPNRFSPHAFIEFMKKQAKHVLDYAKDLKEIGGILGAEQFDEAALNKKKEDLENVESVFDSTEDFLLKALSSLYKKPEGDGPAPPPMCGSFVEYLKDIHKENIPFDEKVAKDLIAVDFECLGDKIQGAFDKFDEVASGTPNPEELLETILRTLARITSINRAERMFFGALVKVYPEEEEEEEEEEGGDKKREMKDELLKLLLKRVLDNEPANKRSFGAVRSLLGRKHSK